MKVTITIGRDSPSLYAEGSEVTITGRCANDVDAHELLDKALTAMKPKQRSNETANSNRTKDWG